MLGMTGAVAAAMRPIELQSVAHRPAQHLVDRPAQGLGLDVDERVSIAAIAIWLIPPAACRVAA
jgi:hypothetical protein